MKVNVENNARLVFKGNKYSNKTTAAHFSRQKDQLLDTKFKVISLSMVKRPDQWRMIKEIERTFLSYSVKSRGQAFKSQKHIQSGRNLFTTRQLLIKIVSLKSRQEGSYHTRGEDHRINMCEEKKISFEFSSPFEIFLSIILRCTCDIKLHSDVWRNQEIRSLYLT